MRSLFFSFVFLVAQVYFAAAQTPDDVKTDVMAALSTPLPITVIGPMIARDVEVVAEGKGFRATLIEPMLMGIIPVNKMSFKLTPAGDGLYRVTEFTLPDKLDLLNFAELSLGRTQFDGLWSTQTRSYQTLGFELHDVGVVPKGSGANKIRIGSLALNVIKEGEAGATESKFSIKLSNFSSQGFPPYNLKIAKVEAELNANGEKPVDLYSVISRFAVLSSMQKNGDAVLQFAESLRAQRYDTAILNLIAEGIDVSGADQGSNLRLVIGNVTGAVGLTGVTPNEWGTVSIKFNGTKMNDKGILGTQEMNLDSGSVTLDGSRIPIGATLNALTKMQAISRGEAVSIQVSELLDGLLNMGALKFSSIASGISYVPDNKSDPVVKIGGYAFETGTEGFRDDKGRVFVDTSITGMEVKLSNFRNALEEKTYHLLNPKLLRYNLSVAELNMPLLRKLTANVTLATSDDYAALAAPAIAYFMALKPKVDTVDAHYQSAEVEASLSSSLRFYPAWVMEALSSEGQSTVKISGLDKVSALLEEYLATPSDAGGAASSDRAAFMMGQSFISTFRALAISVGGTDTWNILYPKAGQGLMMVNETELRFPNFTAYLTPLMMMGTGIFSSSSVIEPIPVAP